MPDRFPLLALFFALGTGSAVAVGACGSDSSPESPAASDAAADGTGFDGTSPDAAGPDGATSEAGTDAADAGSDGADGAVADTGSDASMCSGYVDISAGQGLASGTYPSAVIDVANAKLLVATDGPLSSKPALFRCNLDGSACTFADISAGQPSNSGHNPSAVIDTAGGKLLVVTSSGQGKASLFRCNLDGTSCTFSDISAGQAALSGGSPSAVIDAVNGKLLVLADNDANTTDTLALYRCDLDGSNCTYTDLSLATGQGVNSGREPSAVIDTANSKLLVVARTGLDKPGLYRCNLDGSACTYTDISAGQGLSGHAPSTAIDVANAKLLVATWNGSNQNKPALFRCNLDGSACTYTDISAGQGAAYSPSLKIDTANSKVLVAAHGSTDKPALYRCNLDGSACTYTDISAGQPANSATRVLSAALDAANQRLLVVAENAANGERPALFKVCLP